MIHLHTEVTKENFINQLKAEVKSFGDLIIAIDSLPAWCNTGITFSNLIYQIRSYPRRIDWRTEHIELAEYLNNIGAIKVNYYEKPTNRTPNIVSVSTGTKYQNQTPRLQHNSSPVPKYSLPKPQEVNQYSLENYTNQTEYLEQNDPYNYNTQTENRINKYQPNTDQVDTNYPSDRYEIALSNAINTNYQEYNPIPDKKIINNSKSDSSFDEWLEKIEKAKSRIENTRKQDSHYTSQSQSKFQNNTYLNPLKKHTAFNKLFKITLACSLLAGILFVSSIFKGTDVYTITVALTKSTANVTLEMDFDDFIPTPFATSETTTISPTGNLQGATSTKSSGTVKFENSSAPITIATTGIVLTDGNNKYNLTPKADTPSEINIQANSISEGLYDIIAQNDGLETRQPTGKVLTLVSQSGAKLSPQDSLTAQVIDPVVIKGSQGTATASDLKLLSDTNLAKHTLKMQAKILELNKLPDTYIYKSSFTTITTLPTYNAKENDTLPLLTFSATYDSKIFALTKKTLESKLSKSISNFYGIDKLNINAVQGTFVSNSKLSLSVAVTYLETPPISEASASAILSQSLSLSEKENRLRSNTPLIKNLTQNETARFNLSPVINPNININVVPENIKK
jgi:hypothetical protein